MISEKKSSTKTLRVSEIFYSLNGEVCSAGQGSPAVFIRLAGCNMKCPYCDTPETIPLEGL